MSDRNGSPSHATSIRGKRSMPCQAPVFLFQLVLRAGGRDRGQAVSEVRADRYVPPNGQAVGSTPRSDMDVRFEADSNIGTAPCAASRSGERTAPVRTAFRMSRSPHPSSRKDGGSSIAEGRDRAPAPTDPTDTRADPTNRGSRARRLRMMIVFASLCPDTGLVQSKFRVDPREEA